MLAQHFNYDELNQRTEEITTQLCNDGFIAIKNVPDFFNCYQSFLEAAIKFIALNDEEKEKYIPTNYYISGWSYGAESYNNIQDKYKGSYYAEYPDSSENIWPDLLNFRGSYLKLANIIFEVGKQVLSLINCYTGGLSATARMLYYNSIEEMNESEKNQNWCGLHRDHSLFTGLCSAAYLKDGNVIPEPADCGLIIEGKKITYDTDVLLFQVGEAAELISNGKITATNHRVKKAHGIRCERYTFAIFFNADPNFKIHSNVLKYNDRFHSGMKYKDWFEAAFKRYKT